MKTATIQPYLFLSGRCDEAIEFYRKELGAQVDMLMHYSDSPCPPPPGQLQPGFENKVMHSTVRIGGAVVMMSDGCNDKEKLSGFRLSLTLPTENETKKAFDALSKGGTTQMPLGKTFWSPCFGMVVDRFGVGWMVGVATEQTA
jgi:PhnB protein